MQVRRIISQAVVTLAVIAAGALWSCQAGVADPITVNVNGSPVDFNGPAPIERDGSVLVPLRGVFEALGAGVVYDSDTRTISARKGHRFVELPIGSSEATVNGQQESLSVPATVTDGSTFVPLRFVAEALGAYVEWQAADNAVAISTSDEHAADVSASPETTLVDGTLISVDSSTFPRQMIVRVNGVNTSIPVGRSAVVYSAAPGQPREQVAMNELQPGDTVTVNRNDHGFADTISIRYVLLRGIVASTGRTAGGRSMLTLRDGTTIPLADNVRLRMNGQDIALSDITPGEHVVVRTDPDSRRAYAVIVNPAYAHHQGQQ